MQKKIIIFEMDPARKGYLKSILDMEGYLVFCFDNLANCLDNIDQIDADLIVLSPITGTKALKIINALIAMRCALPILLIIEDNGIRRYLESNRLNHIKMIDGNYDLQMFKRAVQIALQQKKTSIKMDLSSFLVGSSLELLRIKNSIAHLGRLNESVLITGEPGTGKETLARAIHKASGRDVEHFFKIDALELNGNRTFSLLRELKKRGLSPQGCQDGFNKTIPESWTIYLKEIGALPDHLQAELLLIAASTNDNYRILSGSNHDIQALVDEGRFRKDLYYRLNVLNLTIPPLRHRREDIPLLTDFFSYKFCRDFDKTCLLISNRLKDMFMHYHWPGNLKELKGMVQRAVTDGEKQVINSNLKMNNPDNRSLVWERWSRELVSLEEEMTVEKEYFRQIGKLPLKKICWNFMSRVEQRSLRVALEATNWNRRKAASMLNISYKSMLNKIKTYGLA